MEKWKRIEDTLYLISSYGRVYSEMSDIILKPTINNNGYAYVDLFINKKKCRKLVHRLVAIAFLPNAAEKNIVNHLDGNKANNTITNLEWCTLSENMKHAIDIGLVKRGEDKSSSKLTNSDIIAIQKIFEEKTLCDSDIAREFGVTSGVISSIRLGKTWRHVNGKTYPLNGPNPKKKLKGEDIKDIRALFLKGKNDAEIGRIYNVARGTINQIRQGKTWRNF